MKRNHIVAANILGTADGRTRRYLIYVGADKAGSTWYHRVLSAHPEVATTSAKDLYFFDREYWRGIEWYGKQFPRGDIGTKFWCELSHDYMYSDVAMKRISETLHSVDAIISLRHPLERAVSEYLHLYRMGYIEEFDNFEANFQRFRSALVERSLYSTPVAAALDALGKDRVQIFNFDSLKRDSQAHALEVARRLGLDSSGIDADTASGRYNEAVETRRLVSPRILRFASGLMRSVGMARTLGGLKGNAVVRSMAFRQPGVGHSDVAVPVRVVEEIRSDVATLSTLVGLPFTQSWGDRWGDTG